MEVNEIIQNIFGSNVIEEEDDSNSTESREGSTLYARQLHSLSLAKDYIATALIEQKNVETSEDIEGRIGPKSVIFDVLTHHVR